MPDIVRSDLLRGENAALVLLILMALVALLLLAGIFTALRLRRLNLRINALVRGAEGHNLEQTLTAHLDKVEQTQRQMTALEQAVAALQAQMPGCLQRVHLLRYDAFEDVGGEQSFSLALLNAQGDGLVLSSVYSRMDVRVYAKAIQDGKPSHGLSQEEERLLRELASKG